MRDPGGETTSYVVLRPPSEPSDPARGLPYLGDSGPITAGVKELLLELDLVVGLSILGEGMRDRTVGVDSREDVCSVSAADWSVCARIGVLGRGLCMTGGVDSLKVLVDAGDGGTEVSVGVSCVGDIGS